MKIENRPKYILLFALITDLFILVTSLWVSLHKVSDLWRIESADLFVFAVFGLIWIYIITNKELYEIPELIYADRILQKNISGLFTYFIIISTLAYFLFIDISRVFLAYFFLIFSLSIFVWRIILIQLIKVYRRNGNYRRNLIVVGVNENVKRVIDIIDRRKDSGFTLLGYFYDSGNEKDFSRKLGNLDDVKDFCQRNQVDDLLISLPNECNHYIDDILFFGENNLIRVSILPEFTDYLSQIFAIDYFETIPILKLRQEPMQKLTSKMLKRGFDLFFSWLVVILILSWLFPIIAIIIKLTSKGPVLFTQLRTGRDGKPFKCYKFRTMKVNGECDQQQAIKDDPRVTKIGRFLRRTSIDEFPQFFNVIKKNMSVVGPRPHMLKHTEDFRVRADKFMVRHYAKPGITGWAQVNGFRGEITDKNELINRARADIWYIENWSFLLDLKIIFLTAWMILFHKEEKAF